MRLIHSAHIEHVPFENLDIHLGTPIILDEERIFEKIVSRERGGFCYELNGLFAVLLGALGYKVIRLSARVFDNGEPGPEFDHLVLLVDLVEETSRFHLVDVGFGDAFRVPLKLESDCEQPQPMGKYRLRKTGGEWIYSKFDPREEIWKPQYRFTLQPRSLSDFHAMCLHHQSSSDTHFTQKRLATIGIPDGRITLSDNRLIRTINGERRETKITGEDAYIKALKTHFNISI